MKRFSGEVANGYGVTGVYVPRAAPETAANANANAAGLASPEKQPPGAEAPRSHTKPAVWPQFLAACVVNLNTFAFGSSMVWPAMALPQLQSAEDGVVSQPLTVDEGSWVSSLLAVAAVVFTPVFSALTEFVPRKPFGYLTVAPLLVSWILKIASTNTGYLYIARILAGINAAASLVLPSIYVSEIASNEVRGALGCLLGLISNSGVLFSYVVGAYLPYSAVLYLNLVPLLLFAVGFAFLPETPYWLAKKRQYPEARQSLRWLRRGITEDQLEHEMALIEASLGRHKAKAGAGADAGAERPALERQACSRAAVVGLCLIVMVAVNQQLCGLFAVINYAVFIFEEGGNALSPELATIIMGLLQVAGGVLSTPLMDYVGRRTIFFVTNVFASASLIALGAYFYLRTETATDVSSVGWLPVLCLSLFVMVMAVGPGPLPYVLVMELVAPRLRGLASVLGFCTIWGLAALMSKLYPFMSDAMGEYGSFWFFAAVSIACTVVGLAALPETKGRPLDSILRDLNGGKSVFTVSS
ncbi:facilitated trehalose transporter Tret1-like [Schistocerca nitens]|uniref:facilitated trehalose transporter Tret1-like n=1 Tax=Schistocerca nitens TaxID=7011 RepID=UPI0021193ABA|nr:facilitated trehalose transporter Tret1-like [Schistocerca nitens]